MSDRLRRLDHYQKMIHDVLLKEWDPIGVADEPCVVDEYDSYR